MKNWVNLHSHDIWSKLDGYGTQEKYAARAIELGQPALATTNHGNVWGIYKHYKTCMKLGIKPILGIELYQARVDRHNRDPEELSGKATTEWGQRGPHHLTVLAKNNAGYKNLLKLSSRTYTEGFYGKPRADMETIADHSDGLIILSGCLSGQVQQALLRDDYQAALLHAATMQEIVGPENYFIEIMNHGISEELAVIPDLIKIAKQIGAKITPTNDTHYVNREDHDAHDTMLCISAGGLKHEEERFKFSGPHFYLKSFEEMAELFEEEWLTNTMDVAEMCDVNIEFDNMYFPSFPDVPKDKTPDEFFIEEAWRGMEARFGRNLSDEYRDRAEYELSVIRKMGFQEYYLVVADIIKASKEAGVHIGAGRGSAAGSIISYAMGITNLDPIKYDLMFERFLNPERISMPDIDIDTDDRDWMIQYSKDRYGTDRVAQIATFTRIKPKSAIRDAARVLGYEVSVADKITKLVPPAVMGKDKTMDEALASPDMVKAYNSDEDVRTILDAAKGLEGKIRSTGVHAAGVVIAPSDITDYIPIMTPKPGDDTKLTQCDMYEVEDLGLLKMDYLGLRNLWVIADAIEKVEQRHGVKIIEEDLDLDDPATYKLLQAGNAMGVFQVESGGMREIMLDMQPENIFDIMALIALYRPGPMQSGMHHMYINRKHGRAKVEAPHPILQEDLKKSLGIMLYQEDVIKVLSKLAGWTLSEADTVRKIIGKKLRDQVAGYRSKFVDGCIKTNNVPKQLADKIWTDIEYFADYGFNKAHSISYALVVFTTAYLKANYPVEYMASLLSSIALSSGSDKQEKMATYLRECKRMGIAVLPPSISDSEVGFSVEDDKTIRFGLGAIRGVGDSMLESIMSNREHYDNLFDFLRKVEQNVLNAGSISNLYKSGALDELVSEVDILKMTATEKREYLLDERHSLGVYLTQHPLDDVIHVIDPLVDSTIGALGDIREGTELRLGGVINHVQKKNTKRGDTMYILNFEDLTGSLEVICFPKVAKDYPDGFTVGDIVILEGRLQREVKENEEGEVIDVLNKIFMSSVTTPDLPEVSEPPIQIKLTHQPSYDILVRMDKLLALNPGDSEVFLEFPDEDKLISVKFNKKSSVEVTEDLKMIGVC